MSLALLDVLRKFSSAAVVYLRLLTCGVTKNLLLGLTRAGVRWAMSRRLSLRTLVVLMLRDLVMRLARAWSFVGFYSGRTLIRGPKARFPPTLCRKRTVSDGTMSRLWLRHIR